MLGPRNGAHHVGVTTMGLALWAGDHDSGRAALRDDLYHSLSFTSTSVSILVSSRVLAFLSISISLSPSISTPLCRPFYVLTFSPPRTTAEIASVPALLCLIPIHPPCPPAPLPDLSSALAKMSM